MNDRVLRFHWKERCWERDARSKTIGDGEMQM
jgi:hypothetical protein